MNEPKVAPINIHASLTDDMVRCECGCEKFLQSANVVKVIPPMIGAKPLLYPVPQTMTLICVECRKVADPTTVKSDKEKRSGIVAGSIGGI